MATQDTTGIPVGSKACARCRKIKPHTDFGKFAGRPLGLNYYCFECAREAGRKAAAKVTQARVARIEARAEKQIERGEVFTCTGCGETKPLISFRYDSRKPRGHDTKCKSCVLARSSTIYEGHLNVRRSMVSNGSKKHCTLCGLDKPIVEFQEDKTALSGSRSRCRECVGKCHTKWRERRGDGEDTSPKRNPLTKSYGVTKATFDLMMDAQGHACAICQVRLEHKFPNKKINIDHDHSTGKVRSLLCTPCNTGLGSFKDDTKLLKSAVAYLQRHSDQK